MHMNPCRDHRKDVLRMKEWTGEAVLSNLPSVTSTLDGWLEEISCPMKAQMQLDVAVDELFSNISSYAYSPGQGNATIRMNFNEADRMISVTFTDQGIPFNPLEKKDPDTTLSAAEREVGGLGIFLVKKTMDGMEYKREGNKNIVTIHKKI